MKPAVPCRSWLGMPQTRSILDQNSQTWQACQCSKVVQMGPKGTKMVYPSIFDHLVGALLGVECSSLLWSLLSLTFTFPNINNNHVDKSFTYDKRCLERDNVIFPSQTTIIYFNHMRRWGQAENDHQITITIITSSSFSWGPFSTPHYHGSPANSHQSKCHHGGVLTTVVIKVGNMSLVDSHHYMY